MPSQISLLRPKEVSHVDRGANKRPYFLVKSDDGQQAQVDAARLAALVKDGSLPADDVSEMFDGDGMGVSDIDTVRGVLGDLLEKSKLGDFIKSRAGKLKFSANELGRRSNMSGSGISAMMRGDVKRPTDKCLKALAPILDTSFSNLLSLIPADLRKQAGSDEPEGKEDSTMPHPIDVSKVTKADGTIDPSLVTEALQPLAKQLADAGITAEDGKVDLETVDEQHRAGIQAVAASPLEKADSEGDGDGDDDGDDAVDFDALRKDDGTIDVDRVPDGMKQLAKSLNDQAAQLKKASDELAVERGIRIRKEMEEHARESYGHIGSPDDVGGLLHKCREQLDDDTFAQLEKTLGAAQERIDKSTLFGEIGSSAPGVGTGSPMEKIEKAAEAMMSQDAELTKSAAIAKAMDQNPDLYREYMAAHPSSH